MSQHDTLTLREALRSIQYEAASLADAQVIALQALNATYPARAALSATQPAQAAQGAGEVVAIHPSWLDCWSFNECDRLARIWTAGIDLTKSDDHDNDLGPQWKVVMAIMLARLAHRAAVAPTQPAAGADVLDAERYRWLRAQDNEDFAFAVVKNPHFDVYESPEELDAVIDAAIAASGRKS